MHARRNAAASRRLDPFRVVLIALGAAAALGGCGAGNPHGVGTYERARQFADAGKYVEAVAAYESFVRRNPTDSLAAAAQFEKGLAYLEMKEYPLAAVEFQIMRKDYPTSELVEEALYHEGLAYYRQVGRIERDVTGAHEARLHFLEFSQRYPGSPRMPDVVRIMQEISDLMVRKRLAQVKVYRQLRQYGAVAATLDDLLANEAGSSFIPRVLWERAAVAGKLADPDGRRGFLERLVAEHPDSPQAARARRELTGGDGDPGGGPETTAEDS